MQLQTRSRTGVGQTNVWVPDYHIAPFTVGIQVIVTGTVTFNLEYSIDDEVAAQTNWFVLTNWSALTASTAGIFEIPCRGVRVNVTAGTGSVAVTFCQAGRR